MKGLDLKRLIWFLLVGCLMFAHTPFLKETIYNLSVINKIPKIIHQVWVGPNPMPDEYKEYTKTWKAMHPGWEYKLWTNKDVEDFDWINKDMFLRAKNPGMKADIWRYEIVHKYGGVYVDCDMESQRPLDPMHSRLEFYASYLFVLPGQRRYNILGCHLFAAPPGSEILSDLIKALTKNGKRYRIERASPNAVQRISGPTFFSRFIIPRIKNDKNPRTVLFTPEYFHPTSCASRGVPSDDWEKDNIENKCFSTHHNGEAWTKKENQG
ncbi:MAG: hypothetical protein S4CHLAM20_01310 [Chlamydiia bacterium]|nr:hypothetical protein [Chlamydiia bacterium]